MKDDELNFLEYLLVFAKNWRMIVKTCAVTFFLSCAATLLMPNIYIATARLMPPTEGSGGISAMLSGMGDLAALAGISSGGSMSEIYVGVLKSRTVADAIINRFNLMEVYDQEYRVLMYEKLEKIVNISCGIENGIISISVEDEQPERAAQIANAYVEELQQLYVQLSLSSVGRQRTFLEKRLAMVKSDLAKAEDALLLFQKENNAVKLDDQAKAIIEAITQLKGQIASKEVELGVARTFQSEQNHEVKAMREGLSGLKEQLRSLEQSPDGQRVAGDIFISTTNVPDVGMQFARLMREFKVQETLYELLSKQYEMAKVEEARDTSTILVLDLAVPPDKKTKPKRLLIVVMLTFVAGFTAVFYSFVKEYRGRMTVEEVQRWYEIKKCFPRVVRW